MKYIFILIALFSFNFKSNAFKKDKVVFSQSSLKDKLKEKKKELKKAILLNKVLKEKIKTQHHEISSLSHTNGKLIDRVNHLNQSSSPHLVVDKSKIQLSLSLRTNLYFDNTGQVIEKKKKELLSKVSSFIEAGSSLKKIVNIKIIGKGAIVDGPSLDNFYHQQNLNLKRAYRLAAFLISEESGNFKHKESFLGMIDISENTQMNKSSPKENSVKIVLY